MSDSLIELRGLTRSYELGEAQVHALMNVDLSVMRGESIAILGPSGSGKSTLLHLLGLLDTPTSGTYRLGDNDVTSLGPAELASLRNRSIGFVF
ncbi:MAG: ATP-binding cassette domain-containing protein, partial [Planctomycetota bacterium]